ncbi:MAG: OprO/OprP family phosphate-selective porin [Planctomycetaceae bacterium]|jgi:phosphate-selective porin OprO/OprP|nr:OprO/OprP family phosphate-selective porin [Planctomycetaceae bacterium]
MRIRNIGIGIVLSLFLTAGCCLGTAQAEHAQLTPRQKARSKPVQPPADVPAAPAVSAAPAAQKAEAPLGNDIAVLEERINSLESELKKKQDKPDSKKGFTKTFVGRVFFDSYMAADQDGADPATPHPAVLNNLQNWNGLNDMRLGVRGEGYDILDYFVDLSFIQNTGSSGNNAAVSFKDVYLGVKNVPLLEYVRIGHYRVEDGLSHLVGGTNTTSLEFDDRDFALVRRIGISSRHLWAQQRLRFFTGLFYDNDIATSKRYSSQDNQGTIANFRLTYMPYISRGADGKINGKQFILFGGNYSYVDVTKTADGAPVTFTQRFSGLKIGNVFNSTLDSGSYHKIGLEFAAQDGPFSLQAEAFANVYDNAAVAGVPGLRKDRTVSGTSLLARYFLTGDYRKFSAENATWGAAELRHNLDLRKANDWNYAEWLGAWEVFAKWGYTDSRKLFELGGPACGSVHDITLGLNWYWTSQARWMFDYIHVMPGQIRNGLPRDHSDTDIFAVSFRYHF